MERSREFFKNLAAKKKKEARAAPGKPCTPERLKQQAERCEGDHEPKNASEPKRRRVDTEELQIRVRPTVLQVLKLCDKLCLREPPPVLCQWQFCAVVGLTAGALGDEASIRRFVQRRVHHFGRRRVQSIDLSETARSKAAFDTLVSRLCSACSVALLTGVHGESAELLARSLKAVRSAMCGKLFCAVLVDGDPYGMELRSLRKIQGTVTTIMPAASPTQHAKCVTEAALAWAAPWRLKDAVQGLPADPRAAVVQMYANEVSFGGKPGGATAERDSRKTAVQLVEECSASGALPPHPPSYRDSSDYAWCSAAVSGSLEECCRILDDVSLIDADYSRAICPPPEADALGVSALKDVPSAAAKHRQASYFDELRRRGKRNARRGEISRALPFPPSLLPAPGVVPARPEAAAARDTFLLATQHPEDRILIHRLCCEHAPAVHKRPLQNFRLFVAAAAAQSPPEITSRVLEILKTGGPPPGRFANQLADWLNIRGSLAWRVACSALAEVRDPLDTWHGAALAGQRRAARTKGAKVCRTAAECAELANSFK